MKQRSQNFWYIVYSVFFLAIATLMIGSLYLVHENLPISVSVFDLSLLVLATMRVTRLFVYDKIMFFVRDAFQHAEEEYTQEGVTYKRKIERADGPLRTAYELLTCPWCFSLWAALFVAYAYFLNTQLFWLPILIFATSGAGGVIQVFANMIGWIAENKKLEADKKTASKDIL